MKEQMAPGSPASTDYVTGVAQKRRSTEARRTQSSTGLWDTEQWSPPERALLTLVALGAPILLWFYVVDHVPEAWADVAAIPILGLGDLIAAGMFVLCYGSARALVRLLVTKSRGQGPIGRHRG